MAFTPKSISFQLSSGADTVIYTCPASTTAILKQLTLVEQAGAAVTLNVFCRKGAGTSRRVTDKDYALPANEGRSFKDKIDNVILEATDTLRGDASINNVVDGWLSLVEVT